MIGILQNKNLTSAHMKNLLEDHWKNVENHVNRRTSGKKKIENIEKDIKKFFGTKTKVTFKEIVTADYKRLTELKKDWKIEWDKLGIIAKNKRKRAYEKLYGNWRNHNGKELVNKLELSVCPYCNRNHINGAADFDHFFPTSEFPIFAVSLYNLIPACPACNRTMKNKKTIDVSPYDNSKTTDGLLTFSCIPETATTYKPIIKKYDPAMENNINVFKLKEMYSIHTGLVSEIMYKAKKYNTAYVNFLFDLTGFNLSIDLSPDEFYYNNYLSQENYYKRPLSKLTADLKKEFEILP